MSTSNTHHTRHSSSASTCVDIPVEQTATDNTSSQEITDAGADISRGNARYDAMMRQMGHYGHFLPLHRKASCVTPITLNVATIRDGIRVILNTALSCTLAPDLKGDVNLKQIVADTAQTLTNGCMMLLYCRLRSVNRSFIETSSRFLLKPDLPTSIEVPTPYAVAFQLLGLFRVENYTREIELIPIVSAADADSYCLGTQQWSYPAYQNAMEFAERLGISFQRVDLNPKLGSAWWLLKSVDEQDNYNLQCCLPESNYTNEDAVIRALWCVTETVGFHADIADLSSLTMDRGTFLRKPPPDIALTCFYGIMEVPDPRHSDS